MNYEKEIINITNKYTGQLPQSDIDSIVSLAKHGEKGVALENLCTQIFEYELKVSESDFIKLKQIADDIDLHLVDLEDLRSLIK